VSKLCAPNNASMNAMHSVKALKFGEASPKNDPPTSDNSALCQSLHLSPSGAGEFAREDGFERAVASLPDNAFHAREHSFVARVERQPG
jgi:hypothetical protein